MSRLNSDRINITILKFKQETNIQYAIFLGLDNSDGIKFGPISDLDNRNMKNVVFTFKIRTKSS